MNLKQLLVATGIVIEIDDDICKDILTFNHKQRELFRQNVNVLFKSNVDFIKNKPELRS